MTYIYERKQASDLFHDLKSMGRENFSYDGAVALMNFLEENAEQAGEPIEYDPVAFCCDYSEYENLEAFQLEHDAEKYESIHDIEEETIVIRVNDDAFIVAGF